MSTSIFARGSLKTRVTLFTLAIFLVGLWSLAFYASRILREDTQGLLGAQQYSIVSFAAAQIDRELDERSGALEMAASRLSTAVPGKTADLQVRLEQHLLLARYFNGGVAAVGRDGRTLAAVPPTMRQGGLDFLDVDTIAAALREGKPTIGGPRLDRGSAPPVFAMAVPIRDSRARVIGALVGVTRLGAGSFLQTIAASRYGRTGGYVLIAPQARVIIAATDQARIMEQLPGPGVHPVIDRFIEGYQGSAVMVNPLGTEVLASVKGLAAADWILSATLPTAEAFAPVRDVLRRMLIATLFLTLLAGGLTWWLLSRQLAPILAAARALAVQSDTKQLPQPLPVGSQDEIGQLIDGFNRLLETLKQREVLLTQILDTSSVAIFLVDTEGRITQANRRMAEMFGWPLESLIGNEYVALIHPEEREIGRQKMLALLASAISAVDLDRLYWRADRREFWGHLTGRRFYDADGIQRGLVGVIADITERKQMEDQVRQLAFHDELTQLPNRRLLKDRLTQTVAVNKRSGCYGAVMFIDLDNFKPLNDRHGHEFGDLLLIEVADRLRANVRAMDTVARFGGDEFVVIISELDVDQTESIAAADLIAEKIRAALGLPYLLEVRHEGRPGTTVEHICTACIGVTLFLTGPASEEEILQHADAAMYQAKQAGRNSIRFYSGPAEAR